jgi:hypothetical protein
VGKAGARFLSRGDLSESFQDVIGKLRIGMASLTFETSLIPPEGPSREPHEARLRRSKMLGEALQTAQSEALLAGHDFYSKDPGSVASLANL